jgi:hypothetical protein
MGRSRKSAFGQATENKIKVSCDDILARTYPAKGAYQVASEINGAGATITFLKERTTIATVDGKHTELNESCSSNIVVYTRKSDKSLAIAEIRFALEVIVLAE